MRKILFVMSHAPHHGTDLQETLDIVLTAAAFDQRVSLLFLDDGVLQLHQGQSPEKFKLKDTAAIFRALEIYDVRDYFIEVESLQERGLKPGNLILPVREVYRRNINELISHHDVILSG
ncbi:sulfurtransferase complex subunit TusC [Methylomarinum vadi]|uniref:sulfurtransferase complex subunit TusC n=1 Tax=Methylomarinum vadi TaxID=438855 RepID=UPI0004DF5127|nr:sulfurtransferase complex subunit TusC [Methylomarinum vadi]